MSRIPPSLSGGLPCASATDAATASTPPRKPERTHLIEASLSTRCMRPRPLFPSSRSCRKRQGAASDDNSGIFAKRNNRLGEEGAMRGLAKAAEVLFRPRAGGALGAIVLFAAAAGPAYSADCSFEPQGEGRVAAI